MNTLKMLLVTLCVVFLAISVNGAPYQVQEEECDDDKQHALTNNQFLQNANAAYKENTVHLGADSQKWREHYEKLKQKADHFVGTSGANLQDLGIHHTGGSYNKFEAGQSQLSSSHHSSGVNAGIRNPIPSNFYNNDGSLLHTVEGLKAHGQGMQYTATGGLLPLKNYQEGQVFTQNNGGYGSTYEKHSSSSSQRESNLSSGLPATITYTPTGWEKHHQSSSVKVEESTKRRNYTDYSQPELISQQSNTVIHPLNIAYGAQPAGTFSQASKTHANYDQSNSGSYGLYQVPMTVIPVLGSNDANYLSETKSQSLSKTQSLVSSHDSSLGSVDAKPIKIQSVTPSGVDQMWHQLVQGQASSQFVKNPSAVLQTSFGTTEAENDEHLQSHIHPIALTVPQNSGYVSKHQSQQSASSSSSFQSSSGSSSSGKSAQINSEIKGSSGGRVPTNTFVGNPNAPQNSGYAITGENKGFYTKSVELANLLSATISPIEEQQIKNGQLIEKESQSSQSGSASTFIEKERNPAVVSGGKGYADGYQSYQKQESSSSQYEKAQGSQSSGSQSSYSGVPVINEPYRGSGAYNGGSMYDWSTSGTGYGQYTQHGSHLRPVSGYGIQSGSGYNSNGKASSGYQSWQSSSGSQSSSASHSSSGRGAEGVVCRECTEGIARIPYGYGQPVKSSYGLSSQFSSSSSDINGQKSESKQASVSINDNGKVDTYSRHNK